MPSGRLQGRTALITGGSRGIGAAIAVRFAEEGADLAIVHLADEAAAAGTVCLVRDHGRRCEVFDTDVADFAALEASVAAATATLGSIDVLVNCAGVGSGAPFDEHPLQLWHRVIAVNLHGAFYAARLCYPSMKARRYGRIINVSSQMAYLGSPHAAAYSASKAGLLGLTRSLAVEAAPFGVLVNAIAPGATDTAMLAALGGEWGARKRRELPIGRFARPDEIAATALFLASADASFYVGQTLSPNGGDVMP